MTKIVVVHDKWLFRDKEDIAMENTGDYFVMLNLQRGGITPMTHKETGELAMFETQN